MAENYPVTRAQQTILAVVFTLVGMGIMLYMTDFDAYEPESKVTELATETVRRIPGQRTADDLARPHKTEGLPPRPPPEPPLNDSEEWKKQRSEMATNWRNQSITALDRYAAKVGLSAEKKGEAMEVLMEMHDRHDEIRRLLESNSLSREEAQERRVALQSGLEETIIEVLGSEGAEGLRAEMGEMQRVY